MYVHVLQGVTFEEVWSFTEMLDSLNDVDMALGMFHAAGASVTPGRCFFVVCYMYPCTL